MVNCNICNNNISLSINNYLDYYIKIIHLDKLTDTQETHDTAGSSKRFLLFEMD